MVRYQDIPPERRGALLGQHSQPRFHAAPHYNQDVQSTTEVPTMGGYVPNPVTLSAAKVASYWLFGAVARRWASRFRSPLSFAILRGAAGALAGLVFLWVTVAANAVGSDARMYGSFQVLRVLVWAMVLHFWFRPRGGLPALALWTVLGTALSIAVDMLFWVLAQHSFPGATWTIC